MSKYDTIIIDFVQITDKWQCVRARDICLKAISILTHFSQSHLLVQLTILWECPGE